MKGLAFIQDPDGYWIEILNPNKMTTIIQFCENTAFSEDIVGVEKKTYDLRYSDSRSFQD